jgi:hypothetical protein
LLEYNDLKEKIKLDIEEKKRLEEYQFELMQLISESK